MSEYVYLDENVEPDKIDVNDLLHMIQKLALLATQISPEDNIETHVEALELRITELTNENSLFFKNKLKLQDRLEFIMQERDVWKRNAETLKKMYAKLVNEQQRPSSRSSPFNSPSRINKCIIGTHQGNIDPKSPNERAFSATVPRSYLENVRNTNITSLQINTVDNSILNQLSKIQTNHNYQSTPRMNSESTETNCFQKFDDSSYNIDNTSMNDINTDKNNNNYNNKTNTFKKTQNNSELDSTYSDYYQSNESTDSNHSTCIELIENRANTSRKNVSFNKDIDVRVFPKNSRNSKILESYMLPLAAQQSLEQQQQQQQQKNLLENVNKNRKNFVGGSIESLNNLGDSGNNKQIINNDSRSLDTFVQKTLWKSSNQIDVKPQGIDRLLNNRGGICSNRKYPGETPVRDLEPTLKMIIIKELSVEKLDGNDWKMFARRIGISESDIKEWSSLRLQYPMARVLSFWSSKPEATMRLLHRHLNAPCFNYGALAKRIENFYEVL